MPYKKISFNKYFPCFMNNKNKYERDDSDIIQTNICFWIKKSFSGMENGDTFWWWL